MHRASNPQQAALSQEEVRNSYLLKLLNEQRESAPLNGKLVWLQCNADKVLKLAAIRSNIKRNLPPNLEHFSPNDLCRTFISRCSEMKLDVVAIEKNSGPPAPWNA